MAQPEMTHQVRKAMARFYRVDRHASKQILPKKAERPPDCVSNPTCPLRCETVAKLRRSSE